MKASRPEPEWNRRRRRESDEGEWGFFGGRVQGPPAVPASAKAAVKRGLVFFPRPARRETLPQLTRVKSHC